VVAAPAPVEGGLVTREGGLIVLAATALALLSPLLLMGGLARLSGWTRLAARYPDNGPMPERRTWLGYAVFRGWVGYNGALIVASDSRGLFLRTLPVLLSWAHPPVFIPWSDVERIEHEVRWVVRVHRIHTRRAADVHFALRDRTYAFVRDDARAAHVAGA
jgi:hypothetical protein